MTEARDPSEAVASAPLEPESAPDPAPTRDPAATLEKISAIVSPYFISLVGLYLYNSNALVGLAIAAVGLARLLKIAPGDLRRSWNALLRTLGLTVD